MQRPLAVLALVLSVASGCDRDPAPVEPRARPGSPSPVASGPSGACDVDRPPRVRDGGVFAPEARVVAGRAHLPITFLDGSSATLTYPPDLRLARQGVRPDTTGGEPGAEVRPRVLYGGVSLRLGPVPVRCVETAAGRRAGVWSHPDGDVLVLRFGKWFVSVFETHTDLDAWAAHLRGRVTRDGWLVLRGDRRLEIGPGTSVGDTSLMFGDLSPGVLLWPLRCRAREEAPADVAAGRGIDSPRGKSAFASWCDRDASMQVHVYGRARYARRLASGMRIEDVSLAHRPGRYRIIP